jgi:hypothetical protein
MRTNMASHLLKQYCGTRRGGRARAAPNRTRAAGRRPGGAQREEGRAESQVPRGRILAGISLAENRCGIRVSGLILA